MTPFRKSQATWRRLLIFWLVAWILPALACNYPDLVQPETTPDAKDNRQTQVGSSTAKSTAALPDQPTQPPPIPTMPNEFVPSNLPTPGIPPTSQAFATDDEPVDINYYAQAGDTLQAVAKRFQVQPGQIFSPASLPQTGFLIPGQPLSIPIDPSRLPAWPAIFPDSEILNSPTAADFDIAQFIESAGGFLSTYIENVYGIPFGGDEIVERVSQESSVNPRLLLAFLEYRSGWVFGQPRNPGDLSHPIGFYVKDQTGLYKELAMAAAHLNIGYYGWRTGDLGFLKYSDGRTTAINPWLNPGSVAVQNLFAKFYPPQSWSEALYGSENFPLFYQQSFGNPWERADQVEPLLLPGMVQPPLELPFSAGERWSLTGGPHPAWNLGTPRGAIDFAPVTGEPACSISRTWVTASAPGVVVRSANNVVAIDLDGDGREQTGWTVVYLHIADEGRIPAGQTVQVNDRLGHPSCERGQSTGTHVHIARKYSGEWLEADGPIPFFLSGWRVIAGDKNYRGSLVKGSQEVIANPVGPRTSIIVR
jgi:LasA protease